MLSILKQKWSDFVYHLKAVTNQRYKWQSAEDLPQAKLGYVLTIEFNDERITYVLQAKRFDGIVRWYSKHKVLTGTGTYYLMTLTKYHQLYK